MRPGYTLNHRGFPPHRLIVFGRYPTPGLTKTRLIPTLGPVGAAELHRELTEKTVAAATSFCSAHGISLEICHEGGTCERFLRWLGPHRAYTPQVEGDLGHRMYRAFVDAFSRGSTRVVLVGTDVPGVTAAHLARAFDALGDHDLVLGPSTDGGYWLIGLAKPAPLFHPIDWSTRDVLTQTMRLAKKQGLSVHHLGPMKDVDTREDLTHIDPPWESNPYVSVVVPTLHEGEAIGSAIESARNQDAEVLVVDGGSSDDTVKKAIDAGATVVSSPQGRARQQNRGAAMAEGRVLLFLHADTHLPTGYASHVFEALMDPMTAAGAFRFKTDLNHPLMRLIELVTNMRSRFLQLPYGDQGLFFRKPLFQKVGGFPNVPVAEEIFLLRKVSKLGRIRTLRAQAVTSARRWRRIGLVRTTLINQLILLGIGLGVSTERLATLYDIPKGMEKHP